MEPLRSYTYPSPIVSHNIRRIEYNAIDDIMIFRKKRNLNKLKDIRKLSAGWDGGAALPFNINILDKVEKMILALPYQPELFPVSSGEIQLEMDGKRNAYFELSIGDSDLIDVYSVIDGIETEETIAYSDASKRIKDFYEEHVR